MRNLAARVNVSALHTLVDLDPVRQQPAQNALDAGDYGLFIHISAGFARLHHVANLLHAVKNAGARRTQQPLLEVHVSTDAPNGAEGLQYRETVEQLYKAIQQLPKTDAALVLLYLDDLSYREIAEVLGISESNVGVKLNRAKKALSELMKEKPHVP